MWKFMIGSVLAGLMLVSCATAEVSYPENVFSRAEIAKVNADFFDVDIRTAGAALRPVYGKYGAPHIYIKGQMSAVYDSELERLFGTGTASPKFGLPDNVYWEIEGQNIFDLVKPIKTAHLIYKKEQLPFDTDYANIGELTARGQMFSVFERELDGRIVITLNQTKDLPKASAFETLMMRVSAQ